jgi:rod shape determining protein RodA
MYQKNSGIVKGVDWLMVFLYAMLVLIGLLCIFSVEYRPGDRVVQSFLGYKNFITSVPVVCWLFLFY